MKTSLAFEFKRIFLPLCIFTAIAAVLFAVNALTSDFIGTYHVFDEATEQYFPITGPTNTLVYIPALILCALCFIVPAMQFSYRMKRRGTDLWYALPIKRRNLVLVRLIGGLALILIPYTISYWLGFLIIACKDNLFELVWYVPLFFASLPVALCLFGINAFCFTRANTVGDGIIFMIMLSLALTMPVLFLNNYYYKYTPSLIRNATNFFPFSAVIWIFLDFNSLLLGRSAVSDTGSLIFSCVLCAAEGAAAYFGLIFTADKHKAENAGQISDSLFGYKTLIPWFVFFSVLTMSTPASLLFGSAAFSLINLVVILIGGLIGYFIYRRSFRIKKCDLISLGISFLAGIAFMLLNQYAILPLLD